MGYTNYSFEVVKDLIEQHNIKSVCDLGAQNNFAQPLLPAPYVSEWYTGQGIEYMSIDLSGENDSKKWDLSEPLKTNKKFDMVTDFGTSEHVKNYFQCLANMHKLCRVGGLIVHENPKTGNWPQHGFHYVDKDFYIQFAKAAEYDILMLEEHPAMWNDVDGWNIACVMRKTKNEFIGESQMPEYYKL